MRRTKPRICKLNRGHLLARGCVLDLPLDERGGTSMHDLARRNVGTVTGGPVTWETGRYGPGLHIQGDAAGLGNVAAVQFNQVDLTGPLTIFTRIKLAPSEATNTYCAIIDDVLRNALWKQTGTGQAYFENIIFTNSIITTGDWVNVAITRGPGNTCRCYVDGKVDSVTGTYAPTVSLVSLSTLYASSKYGFRGSMAFARAYNRTLPAWAIRYTVIDPWAPYRRVPLKGVLETIAAHTLLIALTETLSLIDGRSIRAAKMLGEAIALTDARALALAKALLESLPLTAASSLIATKSLTDALGLADAGRLSFGKALAEGLQLADRRSLSAEKDLPELLALNDAGTTQLAKAFAETLGISDHAALRLLIALIITRRTTSGDGDTFGGGIA